MTLSELSSGAGFASDNYAGIHPDVLTALAEVNVGHATAYGDDPVTARLAERMRQLLGEQVETFPVFNGTGANVVALTACLQRWEAVVAAESGHINTDEGGAPEVTGGFKIHALPTPDGKLTPELLATACVDVGFVHRAQQGAVSLTQATEFGTLYTPEEIAALADVAHAHDLAVHLDGARIANACAALEVSLRDMLAHVDVVSLGGTKNGAMGAEAVVVLDPTRVRGVDFLRKTHMQLASKMRFVSAQLLGLFDGDLWLDNARHANAMARLLAAGVQEIDGVRLSQTPQANGVFVILPDAVARRLMQRVPFYFWNEPRGEVRLMCSFDTSEQDITQFLALLRQELAR